MTDVAAPGGGGLTAGRRPAAAPELIPGVTHPLGDDLVELIAGRFRALSEPTRIKLLDRLRAGEATVLELSRLLDTTPQNVSKHLGLLHREGIVARRKQGNFVAYRIADEGVFTLCEAVCGGLRQRIASLRLVVGPEGG